jgi:hypothetical protein
VAFKLGRLSVACGALADWKCLQSAKIMSTYVVATEESVECGSQSCTRTTGMGRDVPDKLVRPMRMTSFQLGLLAGVLLPLA